MSKRSANEQLTSDNWEQDNEEEEVSTGFKKASDDELKRRPMKMARRTKSNQDDKQSSGIFSSINLTGSFKPLVPQSTVPLLAPTITPSLAPSISFTALPMSTPLPQKDYDSNYIHKLRSLNESVTKWISDHVRANPCIDLTPVFEDYQRYLRELDQVDNDDKLEDTEKDQNGKTPDHQSSDSEESTSCQDKPHSPSPQTISSEPDSDCLFAVRSKLYYKKENQFVELGVGKLRVEQQEHGVRLLLRNDTSIGQILLNVQITDSIPITLQKNSIMFVTFPNPPLEISSPDKTESTPTPVTYLLKVKDTVFAEQLHSTIKNNL